MTDDIHRFGRLLAPSRRLVMPNGKPMAPRIVDQCVAFALTALRLEDAGAELTRVMEQVAKLDEDELSVDDEFRLACLDAVATMQGEVRAAVDVLKASEGGEGSEEGKHAAD